MYLRESLLWRADMDPLIHEHVDSLLYGVYVNNGIYPYMGSDMTAGLHTLRSWWTSLAALDGHHQNIEAVVKNKGPVYTKCTGLYPVPFFNPYNHNIDGRVDRIVYDFSSILSTVASYTLNNLHKEGLAFINIINSSCVFFTDIDIHVYLKSEKALGDTKASLDACALRFLFFTKTCKILVENFEIVKCDTELGPGVASGMLMHTMSTISNAIPSFMATGIKRAKQVATSTAAYVYTAPVDPNDLYFFIRMLELTRLPAELINYYMLAWTHTNINTPAKTIVGATIVPAYNGRTTYAIDTTPASFRNSWMDMFVYYLITLTPYVFAGFVNVCVFPSVSMHVAHVHYPFAYFADEKMDAFFKEGDRAKASCGIFLPWFLQTPAHKHTNVWVDFAKLGCVMLDYALGWTQGGSRINWTLLDEYTTDAFLDGSADRIHAFLEACTPPATETDAHRIYTAAYPALERYFLMVRSAYIRELATDETTTGPLFAAVFGPTQLDTDLFISENGLVPPLTLPDGFLTYVKNRRCTERFGFFL